MYRTDKIDFSILLDEKTGDFRFSVWYLAITLKPVVVIIFAYRWHLFLLLNNINIPFSSSLRLTTIGNLFMTVLPGAVGGDIIKAFGIVKNSSSKRTEIIIATIIDRILGIYSLLIIVSASSGVYLYYYRQYLILQISYFNMLKWIFITSSTLLLVAPVLFIIIKKIRIHNLQNPLIVYFIGFKKILGLFKRANNASNITLKMFVRLIFLSVIGHILNFVIIICIAQAINDQLQPSAHLVLSSVSIFGYLIPLTPGGIGISEGIFAYVYLMAGSSNGALIGFISRLFNYIVYVGLGLPVYIFTQSNIYIKKPTFYN